MSFLDVMRGILQQERLLPREPAQALSHRPLFALGQGVLLSNNTGTASGTIVEEPWWQQERPYLAGWWYTIERVDGIYTLIHESRLTAAPGRHLGNARIIEVERGRDGPI